MLNGYIKAQIKEHATLEAPNECCGLIVFNHTDKKPAVVRGRNISPTPTKHFELAPDSFLRAATRGNILACYHSHDDGGARFSEYDKEQAELNQISYVVYAVREDEFDTYTPMGVVSPYVGRAFHIGISDCFSLIREYYKNELGISISDYPRGKDWLRDTPHIYEDNYQKEGFLAVSFDERQKHDILLMQLAPDTDAVTHAAIHLGNDLILHHPHDCRYSLIEPYNPLYKNKTKLVLRHESAI
jgi:proteasome lid subunit RPN8/RPN11